MKAVKEYIKGMEYFRSRFQMDKKGGRNTGKNQEAT
jgi:hypothetical protein